MRLLPRSRLDGIVIIVLTTLLFAVHDATLKYLTLFFAVPLLVWTRYTLQCLVMLVTLAPSMKSELFVTRHPFLMGIRALMQVGSASFFQMALKHMPLAETTSLTFVSPLIVALFAGSLLGEKFGWRNALATLAGFLGVLLIARPGGEMVAIGVAYALAAALCSALYQIFTRKLTRSEPPLRQLFYSTLAGTLAMSFALPEYGIPDQLPAAHVALLVAAALSVALGHLLLIHAARETPAATLSTLLYIKLIWAMGLGWAIFGQLPDLWSTAGMVIIGVSSLSLALHRPRPAAVALAESP